MAPDLNPASGKRGGALLGHISDDKFDLVSRAEALAMLDELLGDWATASVPATDRISLWDQVESELEARFAKALDDWAAESGPSVLYRRGAVLNGKRTAELHISRSDGQLVHWQVTLQNTIEGTHLLLKVSGTEYLLVAVKPRGEAYENLDRYACQVNPVSGGIEFVDVVHVESSVLPRLEVALPAHPAPAPLFAALVPKYLIPARHRAKSQITSTGKPRSAQLDINAQ